EFEEEDLLRSLRLIRFNTSKKDTTIKWHFSNYTVKNNQDGEMGTIDDDDGDFYRKLGEEAVKLWDRAFQIITQEYCLAKGEEQDCKTIKVELADDEGDKDLGDLRYNILNLVKSKVIYHTGLLGHAPSYAKADTGQIVGTTANVFIHNTSKIYANFIYSYIRHEIFRKKNNAICSKGEVKAKEKELHAVTPYVREKIETRCPEVISFICEQKSKNLKPRDPLGDSKVIEKCEREVSKETILSIILHEMGHTFGLGHNFKGSLDKNNYYQSVEDLKKYFPYADGFELFKSSSVMDYIPVDSPPITVIGKYDLASLRYLYLDQLESKSYSGYNPQDNEQTLKEVLIDLKIEKKPEDQSPMDNNTLSQMRVYESCWDTVINKTFDPKVEDFLCIREDYGSSPKEIVEQYIEQSNRKMFNSERYAYAKTKEQRNPRTQELVPNFGFPGNRLKRIIGFYQYLDNLKEINLRAAGEADKSIVSIAISEKLKEKGLTDYEVALEKYSCDDKEFQAGQCKKRIYDLYYPVREPIFNFFRENVFLKSMKCEVQNEKGQSVFLNLEHIKRKILPELGPDLMVENCESEQVQKFLADHNMPYLGQTGLENFQSYFSEGHKKNKVDVNPIYNIVSSFIKKIQPGRFIFDPVYVSFIVDALEKSFDLNEDGDITNGGLSAADLKTLNSIVNDLFNVFSKMKFLSLQLNEKMLKTIRFNEMYFSYENFIMASSKQGKNMGSFYDQFQKPLDNGQTPETVFSAMPFLQRAYADFKDELIKKPGDWANKSFQDYLISRDDVLLIIVDGDIESFYTSSLPDGLFQHIFRKYNQLEKEVKRLDKKKLQEGLSKLEEMQKENMEDFQDAILRITDIKQ
ncbi:MAG: zinc-dependent metalloprotease, partial [Bdellovibrionales bacterium]|nr:zinc-dependent metalloprotease [Bdellovibrionales bacterium]